jgi:amylosucrase
VYNYLLHSYLTTRLEARKINAAGPDAAFYARLMANATAIHRLYFNLYGSHAKAQEQFEHLLESVFDAYQNRSTELKEQDQAKAAQQGWFLSNELAGMSLYVDRFATNLKGLGNRLDYLKTLGINVLHLMPLFQSPAGESDGGYAVSNFRVVDERFGTLEDLTSLRAQMRKDGMYLMLDIVLNHTSYQHEWAKRARRGEREYQDFYYFFNDRMLPDEFEKTMPEIFPESAPGSFSYVPECKKWVMSVFHNYQWDLNFTNPAVLIAMVENIYFYANLGVDILRIDAPAFIWKQLGTTCQNLPEAHELLRLIRLLVEVSTPGMALLGEAIVAPKEIMKYFGTGEFTARECDFAYNATQMALQWDALATADTRVMLAAQADLLQKPQGASWITYTRCHDDIGLGYEDEMITQAGYQPYPHRKFLKDYYSGVYPGSPAAGALFSVNPKTQDARISGSLASLCGLERALESQNAADIQTAINKIFLMQAHSFFIGGLPMLFYGDESGYTNDYTYREDPAKSYDNRWMHRPVIDWKRNENIEKSGTIEYQIYEGTRKLLALRRQLPMIADRKNLRWCAGHNPQVATYLRHGSEGQLFCVFNFSNLLAPLTWFAFKEHGIKPTKMLDHWSGETIKLGADHQYLKIPPYGFMILEVRS